MFRHENEKFVKKDTLFKTKEMDKMQDMYASSMESVLQHTQILQESNFQVAGIKHKDGEEMSKIKMYQGELAAYMYIELSQVQDRFDSQLKTIQSLYSNLVESCQRYIHGHKHPITSSGKARLHLVKGTLSLAEQEKAKFENNAAELYTYACEKNTSLLWGNVIGLIRGSDFDLDQVKDVQTGGAATSEVQIIKGEKSDYYFKKEEKLQNAEIMFRETYIDHCMDEKDLSLYTSLENLMKPISEIPDISDALKTATDQADMERIIDSIKSRLGNSEVKWEDPKVQEILKDTVPKYKMWVDRMVASRVAEIGDGEVLSNRNTLTSRLAIILKNPSLVTLANTATLHHSGLLMQEGVVMAQAKGTEYAKVLREAGRNNVVYTPEAIRQFSSLQLFDTICGQIDRHEANIFVTTVKIGNQTVITGVQGIDNDLAFGKLNYETINSNFKTNHLPAFVTEDDQTPEDLLEKLKDTMEKMEAVPELYQKLAEELEYKINNTFYIKVPEEDIADMKQKISQSGSIPEVDEELIHYLDHMSKEISSIPVLDEDLVTELRTMTKENLGYYLGDLLQEDYLEALWDRWNKVVKAIDRMSAKNRSMLVKRGNWNMETAKHFADKDNFYLRIGEMQIVAEPQQ